MTKLVLQARCSLAAVFVSAAVLAGVLILRPPYWIAYAPIILAAGLAALLYYFPARKNLMNAHLIIENTIIPIRPAVLRGRTEEDREEAEKLRDNFGIYISAFGILLGDKIIMFNQSGIWLRKVEIGLDYISFDYGARNDTLQNIRLLYSKPDEDELACIIQKFREYTGVVPVITPLVKPSANLLL